MQEFKCKLCNIEFKTRSGLWKHNNNKHTEVQEEKNLCKYCNKELSDRHSRWKHETKVCKKNPEIKEKLLKTNNIIKYKNNQIIENQIIENQNIIQNQNIQNNNITNNINITFNKIGCEDISVLNQNEMEEIVDNGLNCIIKLIELINFNKEYPQNHTFCTTSLNNKYVSTLNTETNEIEKQRKVDLFDNVLRYALTHIDMLKDNIININKKKEFDNKITELYKIIGDTSYRKIYHEQLNVLSYNKRNIINKTWEEELKDYFNITV